MLAWSASRAAESECIPILRPIAFQKRAHQAGRRAIDRAFAGFPLLDIGPAAIEHPRQRGLREAEGDPGLSEFRFVDCGFLE